MCDLRDRFDSQFRGPGILPFPTYLLTVRTFSSHKYPNGSLQAGFGSRDQMFGRGKAPKFGSDGMISGRSAAISAIAELLFSIDLKFGVDLPWGNVHRLTAGK